MNQRQSEIFQALHKASADSISDGWVDTEQVGWTWLQTDPRGQLRGIANTLAALQRQQIVDGRAHTMGSDIITKWKPRTRGTA